MVAGRGFIFIVFLCLTIGCGKDSADRQAAGDGAVVDSLTIVLQGRAGKSVLEITKEKHEVGYNESPMGVFITRIDSTANQGRYAWIYTVNDSAGQMAADRYITGDFDMIKWHFRKI